MLYLLVVRKLVNLQLFLISCLKLFASCLKLIEKNCPCGQNGFCYCYRFCSNRSKKKTNVAHKKIVLFKLNRSCRTFLVLLKKLSFFLYYTYPLTHVMCTCYIYLNPLSVNPTKWSNTLKQFAAFFIHTQQKNAAIFPQHILSVAPYM